MSAPSAAPLRLAAFVAILTLALAACTGRGDEPPIDDEETAGNGTVTVDRDAPEEPAPEFLGGWAWEPESASVEYAFPLPEDVEPGVSAESEGVTLTVDAVRFGEDRIDARLTVENSRPEGGEEAVLAAGSLTRNRSLELVDDTGVFYPFSPAFEDDEFAVPAASTATTRATFIGRISPEASELILTTNAYARDTGNIRDATPVISVSWPVEAPQNDETLGGFAQHPGRTTLRVEGLETNGDHTIVRATAASRAAADVPRNLAQTDLHLVTADGIQYPIVPPADNPTVEIDPARAHELELVFAGTPDIDAGPVTVVTNARYYYTEATNGLDARTRTPAMAVEELELPDSNVPPARTSHPQFLTASVHGVQVWSDRIAVDAEITSGHPRDLMLDRDPVVLTAADGTEWEAAPTELGRLAPFTTTRVTLVFPGEHRTSPESLELAINGERGGDEAGGNIHPRLIISDIPTEGAGEPVTADSPPEPSMEVTDLPTSVVGEGLELVSDAAVIADILDDLDADTTEDITVTLADEVLFDFDSDVLTEPGRRLIAEVAEVIGFYDDAPVRIEGHTDSHGDPAYNQGLSERRAAAVIDALVSDHDIDPGRLQSQGFGETQPVAPNENPDGSDNPEGRAQNRRVEIIIEADPADVPAGD